jgi:regulator of sigma E protease
VSIIIFLIILGILVLVHEFGHFIAAKKNGVLVEEFGFGFPPRLIGKKIGETIYSLNFN